MLFQGKKGVIMGVANQMSIAASVAQFLHSQGAQLAFSHLPDKDDRGRNEARVRRVTDALNPVLLKPCDVGNDEDIKNFFAAVKETMGSIDFFVHSIAFAPTEDLKQKTVDVSRAGFKLAMDISVYSFISCARAAAELMTSGGSIVTMTYYGGEKVLPGYNLMGVCKAALDCSVKYLAYDLGPKNIRVNAISAGPIKTLASSAVGDFSELLKFYGAVAPLGRAVSQEDVAKASAYLLSDWGSGTTGDVLHVDAGYHVMGSVRKGLRTGEKTTSQEPPTL